MFEVPAQYYRNDTVHRSLGGDADDGILSCGFLHKRHRSPSDAGIVFTHYGALLLLSGEGTHVDCEGRSYRLTPGCFIQRIPGKPHSTLVQPDGKWLEFFICIGRGLFNALAAINAFNSGQDVLHPGVNPALFESCIRFMAALRTAPEEELPLLLCEAQRILLTVYRLHGGNARSENADMVRQACQMLGDPAARASAPDVAARLGMGYERFRKLFRQTVGMAPGEYAIQARINAARSLMIESGGGVKDVAAALGFPDAFTFSRQFAKHTGMPPSEYRRRYR